MPKKIIIIDFGSPYTQLIARRIREQDVYCEIYPYHKLPDWNDSIPGVILSGSSYQTSDEDGPKIDFEELPKNTPVLAIDYSAHTWVTKNGGDLVKNEEADFFEDRLKNVNSSHPLFKGVPSESKIWMNLSESIQSLPEGSQVLASSTENEIVAFQ